MPGLYYPLTNKKRFYEGLVYRTRFKSYSPFFFINYVDYLNSKWIDKKVILNLLTLNNYHKFYMLGSWNWSNIELSLHQYFFNNHFYLIKDSAYFIQRLEQFKKQYIKPASATVKDYNDNQLVYRLNAFWLLYSLYITDLFDKNKVNPYFDNFHDVMTMKHRIKRKRRYNHKWFYDNNQMNEFFVYFGDYKYYGRRNIKLDNVKARDIIKDDGRIFKTQTFSGNYQLGNGYGFSSRYDFLFFKNFYYKYKYKLEDAFYRKAINKIGEFYIYYINFTTDKFFLKIFMYYEYFFHYFFDKLKSYLLSLFFLFIYYIYYKFLPFFFFFQIYFIPDFLMNIILGLFINIQSGFSYLFAGIFNSYAIGFNYFFFINLDSFTYFIFYLLKNLFAIFLLYIYEHYTKEIQDVDYRFGFFIHCILFFLICYYVLFFDFSLYNTYIGSIFPSNP